MKDQDSKLNIMTIVLKSIINCQTMRVKENFQMTCFGHAFFFKACQYANVNERVCKGFKCIS